MAPCKDSLLWTLGDGTVSRQDSFAHTYAQTGLYTMTLEVWHDTLGFKWTQAIVVSCLGVEEIAVEKLSVYPNPSGGLVTIEYSDFKNLKSAQVLSLDGRVLADYPLKQEAVQVLRTRQAAGIYLLRVETSDAAVMVRKIRICSACY